MYQCARRLASNDIRVCSRLHRQTSSPAHSSSWKKKPLPTVTPVTKDPMEALISLLLHSHRVYLSPLFRKSSQSSQAARDSLVIIIIWSGQRTQSMSLTCFCPKLYAGTRLIHLLLSLAAHLRQFQKRFFSVTYFRYCSVTDRCLFIFAALETNCWYFQYAIITIDIYPRR